MTHWFTEAERAEVARRAAMEAASLYRAEEEHASCGVGLVVNVDGTRSRAVVEAGIAALKAIWHRGAVDADGKTGDGAGIHVQIPVAFFEDQIRRTGHEPHEGSGSRWGRCSCRAPTSARRRPAGRSWNPRSCGWATTSTAGGTCR